jgi:hypothetical protein
MVDDQAMMIGVREGERGGRSGAKPMQVGDYIEGSGGRVHHKLDKCVSTRRVDRGQLVSLEDKLRVNTMGFGGAVRQHGSDEPKRGLDLVNQSECREAGNLLARVEACG